MTRDTLITILMLIVGIIHLLPIIGMSGADALTRLYGPSFDEPNIQILMRHRAVIFGILGGIMIYAAFNRPYQPLAMTAAATSILSFIALALHVGQFNEQISKVLWADLAALVCLIPAAILFWISRSTDHG